MSDVGADQKLDMSGVGGLRRDKTVGNGDGRQYGAEKRRFHPYDGTRCVSRVGMVCDSSQGGVETETVENISAEAVAQPHPKQ
ncbi:hypothetical protein QQ045_032999 [Rhodiola kirilowii]